MGFSTFRLGGYTPGDPANFAARYPPPPPPCSYRKALATSKPNSAATGSIDAELLSAAIIARGRLADLHAESGIETADAGMSLIRQRQPSLLRADNDFGVEGASVDHLCGTSSEDRLLSHILGTFPSATKLVSLEDFGRLLAGPLGRGGGGGTNCKASPMGYPETMWGSCEVLLECLRAHAYAGGWRRAQWHWP